MKFQCRVKIKLRRYQFLKLPIKCTFSFREKYINVQKSSTKNNILVNNFCLKNLYDTNFSKFDKNKIKLLCLTKI